MVGGSGLQVTTTTQESELLVAQRSEREGDVGDPASRNYFPIIKLISQKTAILLARANYPFLVLPFGMYFLTWVTLGKERLVTLNQPPGKTKGSQATVKLIRKFKSPVGRICLYFQHLH